MKWISAIKEERYVAGTSVTQTLQIREPLCKTGFIGKMPDQFNIVR